MPPTPVPPTPEPIRPTLPVPLYTATDLRKVEQLAAQAIARAHALPLMERAGQAAAELALEMLGDRGGRVQVFAGPGNNGGDALVVARRLREAFVPVDVVFDGDAGRLPPDAAAALAAWQAAGGSLLREPPPGAACALAIDGLFGIGLKRAPEGRVAGHIAAMAALARHGVPLLALDVPSGLDADTGQVPGTAVEATRTLTFLAFKPGLFTGDGPDCCGETTLADLGVDAPAHVPPSGHALDAGTLAGLRPPRRRNSHKGTYGSVGIVGGAPGMVGAALLAGRAALLAGAGRVTLGLVDEQGPACDPLQPELMLRRWHELPRLEAIDTLAIGPGLGDFPESHAALRWALAAPLPLVVDADGLNLIARDDGLRSALAARSAPSILTPHPAEAARLLGIDTRSVQADRIGSACRLAATFGAGVVLKGTGSISALPGGTGWSLHRTGNPGMATAGMGDVLTGIIAALLAQGLDLQAALTGGVTVHGAAADAVSADAGMPAGLPGLTASEVAWRVRTLLAAATGR
ncbi:MAG: NAD(P)H-hydrate dehydratase [bacterium]